MPCGHVAVPTRSNPSLHSSSRGSSLQSILHPLRIIVPREQHASQVHERDIHTPRTRCACSRPPALSSQAARGVEKSVSYSGTDVYWHHDYPFLVPFTGAASTKCGAFASRMIDARQFIGVPSMQSHARCFAQVMPILQPPPSFARQRARSCPSQ